jgi:hypothetical protein
LIPIVGGLLLMMGQQDRWEALFYYFRLEDQIPEPPAAAHRKAQQFCLVLLYIAAGGRLLWRIKFCDLGES